MATEAAFNIFKRVYAQLLEGYRDNMDGIVKALGTKEREWRPKNPQVANYLRAAANRTVWKLKERQQQQLGRQYERAIPIDNGSDEEEEDDDDSKDSGGDSD